MNFSINNSKIPDAKSKRHLFGPGPCNVSTKVLDAMSSPTVGHLDPVFSKLMEETKEMLRPVFGTQNEMTFPMSAPASLAMEAALVNLLEPGDTAIVGVNGVFGGRMADIVSRIGATPVIVACDWGKPVSLTAMKQAMIDNPGARLVAFVHAETSTGVLTDPGPICQIAKEFGMLSVVDSVTGVIGSKVAADDWSADVVYSGTQKCLSVPPGLAPITFSDRALERIRSRTSPVQSWFCDLNLVMGYWSGEGGRSYHHTAPVNAIYGLYAGLNSILEEGLHRARERHEAAHTQLVEGLNELGLELFVAPEDRLPQLNVVCVPKNIDEAAIRRQLLEAHNIEIGAGLGSLAGRVWRIGLMGENARPHRVELVLNALRNVMSEARLSAAA